MLATILIRSSTIPMLLLLIMIFRTTSIPGLRLSIRASNTTILLLLLLVVICCTGLLWRVVSTLLLLWRRTLIWRLCVSLTRSAGVWRGCTLCRGRGAIVLLLRLARVSRLLLSVGILWVRFVILRIVSTRSTRLCSLRSTSWGKATVLLLSLLWVLTLRRGPRVSWGLRTVEVVSRHCLLKVYR
ncbi:hypothetical protein L873DRAFT_1059473 [Choiromyces venosus 120613-1]|uniref:Uncharacterized protein n=1 Tax=Choiromyces venosus 120613-1 TaxID=1336337 RepID=A0A3N4JN24_9PEZI|nr:hypothetical protein L873DRAFT_1059473 [Choiromyces venosus 120613-1]